MPKAALFTIFVALAAACSNDDDPIVDDDDNDTLARCSGDADCDSGDVCCDGLCERLDLSVNACGACGVVCGSTQYCTGFACAELDFASLCANADTRTLHRLDKQIDEQVDDATADNAAADSIASAFAAFCAKSAFPVVAETSVIENDDSGPLTTGRGTTLVVAGGRVYSYVIDWLDDANVTPVELVVPDGQNFQLVSRSQRKVIASDNLANLTDDLDYIVGQAIYDSTTGTQLLNVYGVFQRGTATGASYFADFIGEAAAGSQHWFVAKLDNGVVTRLAGE